VQHLFVKPSHAERTDDDNIIIYVWDKRFENVKENPILHHILKKITPRLYIVLL
jgi:hypothetical protein